MNQSEPNEKAVLIRGGTLPQILRRLTAMGFKDALNRHYVNLTAQANIQEVAWQRDDIENSMVWLFVSARHPFAHAALANERCAKRRQAEFGRKLHLATEYWLRTIQPRIKDRPLRGTELFLATDAYSRLKRAQEQATAWNNTYQGKAFPVPSDTLVDWNNDEFREPLELCKPANLPKGTLAALAAPMMPTINPGPGSTEIVAISNAHKLMLAEEQYLKDLPEQKRGIDRLLEDFANAFGTVSFAEIRTSNQKNSGQLQLLPPMGQKRKGRTEQDEPLSLTSIRDAVREFLHAHRPQLTQQQYEQDQAQNERLVKQRAIVRLSGGKTRTYQEWQSDCQRDIDDCMNHSRISLQKLCLLRWERFERHLNNRQSIAVNRKPSMADATNRRRKKLQTRVPFSATSSPHTAGKPDKKP